MEISVLEKLYILSKDMQKKLLLLTQKSHTPILIYLIPS